MLPALLSRPKNLLSSSPLIKLFRNQLPILSSQLSKSHNSYVMIWKSKFSSYFCHLCWASLNFFKLTNLNIQVRGVEPAMSAEIATQSCLVWIVVELPMPHDSRFYFCPYIEIWTIPESADPRYSSFSWFCCFWSFYFIIWQTYSAALP